MKKYFTIFLIAACILIVSAGHVWAEEPGHYQLFQGKYTHWDSDSNTATEKEEIFLLDTTSGDVQVYVSTSKDGKQTKYWAPAILDENNQSYTITTTTVHEALPNE